MVAILLSAFLLVFFIVLAIALAGLLDKKAEHFWPAIYLFLDLGVLACVVVALLSDPLTKEVISYLF
jgi:hypothetical protein